MRLGKRGAVLAVAAGALVVGGVSYATIPDSSGVIHACYDKVSGQTRIYDSQTGKPKGCGSGEIAITWMSVGQVDPTSQRAQRRDRPERRDRQERRDRCERAGGTGRL